MKTAGEVFVWFLFGCIAVNVVTHGTQFAAASNAGFGFANSMFAGLTSKKG